MAAPRGFEDRCYECGTVTSTHCAMCSDPVCRRHVGLYVEDAVEIGGGLFIVCKSCCEYCDEAVGLPGTATHAAYETQTVPPFRVFSETIARIREMFTRRK